MEGTYAGQRQLASSKVRVPCNTLVVFCSDGMIIRHDRAVGEAPKIATSAFRESVAEIGPALSNSLIHFPDSRPRYVMPCAAGIQADYQ